MKKLILLSSALMATPWLNAESWEPVHDTMLTEWGAKVTPENAWSEYPRPQLVREGWRNLNGLWDYAVTASSSLAPESWEGTILVPFALETPLSGIGKRLQDDHVIWYRRTFDIAAEHQGRSLLNFEGVDYSCRVWLNGKHIGFHTGGNLPFSFDVSDQIAVGENELVLRVVDETDANDRYQLRGKQLRDNKGIWYTPSSGIWQTVWLETVPSTYIESLRIVGEMSGELSVEATLNGNTSHPTSLRVTVLDDGKPLSQKRTPGKRATFSLEKPKLWSPDSPHLYDLNIELMDHHGEPIDSVNSYAGFRTVGKAKDADGNWRFTLNGEPIFHFGPLDQGWWPDGFLNPPADEAIVFEMDYLKAAGFNMIRKHKKVEPRRYYYHADRLGFLVWQDQPSGGSGRNEWPRWQKLRVLSEGYKPLKKHWGMPGEDPNAYWPDWAHDQFMSELQIMIDTLYNHPSIVVWTTFNESWGQHRSLEIGKWVEDYDPTRHLNIASGGNFVEVGHIADEHNYPHPAYPLEIALYDDYIKAMGEYGGHGWPVEGHLWDKNKRNWGYGGLPQTIEEYVGRYEKSTQMLGELKTNGISAGVYTQTTDVEGEINGLMTYDRKVKKIPADKLKQIHEAAGL